MAQLNGWTVPALPGRMPGFGDFDPPEDLPDEFMSEQEAEELAYDEILATPAFVAEAIGEIIDRAATKPVDVQRLCRPELDAAERTTEELLAVLMSGSREHVLAAVMHFRARVAVELKECIKDRADELLAQYGEPTEDDEPDDAPEPMPW